MGTTIKHPLFQRRNAEDDPSFGREAPSHPVSTDDFLDDSDFGLTGWPDVAPQRPRRARLPSVDAFNFDEACAAQNIARKFGPRVRHRVPDRKRWRLPGKSSYLDPVRAASQKRQGKGRGLFWGVGTALLVIMIAPAVVGIAPLFEALLPGQPADNRAAEIDPASTETSHLPPTADNGAAVVAASTAYSNETARARIRQAASVSTAYAVPAVPPNQNRADALPGTNDSASTIAQRADVPAADEPAFDPVAAVLEPQPIELATPLEVGAAAAPDRESESVVRVAQERHTANVDPQIESKAADDETEEKGLIPVPSPVASTLAPDQIDYLLERGGELLRSGDIASARLLFLRIADTGDVRGAKGVAMTYDPRVFSQLAVTGLTADREQADIWYEKAGQTTFTIDLAPPESSQTVVAITEESGSYDRDAACARKYKSYEPRTGLYTSFSGVKRRCRLP